MKKMYVLALSLAIIAVLYTGQAAFAIDFGATITGGYNGTMNGEKKFPHDDKKRQNSYNLGINIIMDMILDKNKLMNYRVGIGYINSMITGPGGRDVNFFSTHSKHRIMWTNTLGFGIIRKENLRFWIGPQLAMSFDFQKAGRRFPAFGHGMSNDFHKSLYGYIGAVAGIDYSPVQNFLLTAEVGARGGYGGSIDSPKARMKMIEPFINLGFLYRFGGSSIK